MRGWVVEEITEAGTMVFKDGRVANAVEIPWRRAPGMWMLGFSGGEVKGHRFDGLRESFPAINLSHLDLAGGEQRPE